MLFRSASKCKEVPLRFFIEFSWTEHWGINEYITKETIVGTHSLRDFAQKLLQGCYPKEAKPQLDIKIIKLVVHDEEIKDLSPYQINVRYESQPPGLKAIFDLVHTDLERYANMFLGNLQKKYVNGSGFRAEINSVIGTDLPTFSSSPDNKVPVKASELSVLASGRQDAMKEPPVCKLTRSKRHIVEGDLYTESEVRPAKLRRTNTESFQLCTNTLKKD